MNNVDEDLHKPESTVLAASLMSLLGIAIFTIGALLLTGLLLFLYAKLIGFNVKLTNEELLANPTTIPDFFGNIVSYSICSMILRGISMPIIFFLAIKDRFKGSYMNLIDLRKYKAVLCLYAFIFAIVYGGIQYKTYVDMQEQYVANNIKIQEYNYDERGYYDAGVRKVYILPKVALAVFAVSGVITIYVALTTAETVNNKYLSKLMARSQMYNEVYN